MNESYKELLVKKEQGVGEKALRVGCIIPTVILGFLTFVFGNIPLFIITVALGVLDYFIYQWTDVEYEYLYLDKEISIDKIMAKTKRKQVATLKVEKMEILADIGNEKYKIMRSKGLGENEPDMMWHTTMNPETRRLIRVMPEDAELTAQVFDLLLGDNLQGRKEYIAENGAQYLELADLS